MMPTTSLPADTAATNGPLSTAQREQVARATERARKILGAGRVATFNAWSLGVAGGVTLLLGGFSLSALFPGVVLLLLAWNECRGRDLLRSFDPRGPTVLGQNQLALLGLVVAYCLSVIYGAWAHPSRDLQEIQALLGASGDLAIELATRFTAQIYGTVILVSVLVQGLNARYYFARKQLLLDYRKETPAWIVDLQRTAKP